jgi:hypothetical protein
MRRKISQTGNLKVNGMTTLRRPENRRRYSREIEELLREREKWLMTKKAGNENGAAYWSFSSDDKGRQRNKHKIR